MNDTKNVKHVDKEIFSLSEYLQYINDILENDKNKPFFRGENAWHELRLPGLFRNAKHVENEKKLIQEMKSRIPNNIREIDHAIDRLALMQHHGLPTRVLDISTNALIALFFAVSGESQKDGYVYVYSSKENKLSSSDVISIKTALSQLSLDQQAILDLFYRDKSDDTIVDFIDITSNLKKESFSTDLYKPENAGLLNIMRYKQNKIFDKPHAKDAAKSFNRAVDSLYHQLRINVGDFSHRIFKKDLYGTDFVIPSHVDERIIRQSAAFLIVGLNGISKFNKDKNLSTLQQKVDEEISGKNSNRLINTIGICKNNKNKVIEELGRVGINASTVYPGIDEFAKYIKNDVYG